ncbi:hypothetical protein NDN08_000089 [Rhodosorus marinus]|uniref:Hint domain-containing protein n=1 Tax=Rhodosorus marinus TaxID=101924 RepID=A0AAV8UFJ9_9RHOD|nr:hypothetical protein NDN08_000089 [Rhodosorus marinus]
MRTMLLFSVILEFFGCLVLVSGFETSDLPGLYKLVSCESGAGCPEELRIEKFYNVIAREAGEVGIGDSHHFPGFGCSGSGDLFGGIEFASTEDGGKSEDTGFVVGGEPFQDTGVFSLEELNCERWEVIEISILSNGNTTAVFSERDDGNSLVEIKGSYQLTEEPACFSTSSEVRVRRDDGSLTRMPLGEVQVGDFVESLDWRGERSFSKVYLIQHAGSALYSDVIDVHVITVDGGNGRLQVTGDHILLSEGMKPVRASDLKLGDQLLYLSGDDSRAVEASVVELKRARSAVANVNTFNNRLVVNGFAATTHSVPFRLSARLLTPWLDVLASPFKLLSTLGTDRLVKAVDTSLNKLFRK